MNDRKNRIVEAYFDDFNEAFASFSGERVAGKFLIPFMAKGPGTACSVFDSPDDLADYFQAHLDEYEQKGCRQCRHTQLEVKWLGTECALASVHWELLDHGGACLLAWSESYLLSLQDGQALAFATVDHAGGS